MPHPIRKPPSMDYLVQALKAAAEPTRMRIMALCSGNELTVTDLTRILDQSQPRVSKHLRTLFDAGLLIRSREGNHVFHRTAQGGDGGTIARSVLMLAEDSGQVFAKEFEVLKTIKAEHAQQAETYFDEIAKDWDLLRSLHVPDQQIEAALVKALPDEPFERFLDIGTGTGRILELAASRSHTAIGIDKSAKMLAVARTRLERQGSLLDNCSLRLGDMYDLEYRDGHFDVASLHMVLHFAQDPEDVLKEAARVLKPGGRLVITDFVAHELETLREQHGHFWLGFGPERLNRMLESAGLKSRTLEILDGSPISVMLAAADKPNCP